MNLFRLIIVTTLSFLVSQNLITNVITDKKGNVEIIEYYQKSNLEVRLVKKEVYYSNGKLKKVTSYNNDDKNIIEYSKNGDVQDETVYKNGELIGSANQ